MTDKLQACVTCCALGPQHHLHLPAMSWPGRDWRENGLLRSRGRGSWRCDRNAGRGLSLAWAGSLGRPSEGALDSASSSPRGVAVPRDSATVTLSRRQLLPPRTPARARAITWGARTRQSPVTQGSPLPEAAKATQSRTEPLPWSERSVKPSAVPTSSNRHNGYAAWLPRWGHPAVPLRDPWPP